MRVRHYCAHGTCGCGRWMQQAVEWCGWILHSSSDPSSTSLLPVSLSSSSSSAAGVAPRLPSGTPRSKRAWTCLHSLRSCSLLPSSAVAALKHTPKLRILLGTAAIAGWMTMYYVVTRALVEYEYTE
jgi:hypothetical protein